MELEISKNNQKWLGMYLQNCKRLNKSPHTLKNYSADIEKFLVWYELEKGKNLTKINGPTIGEYKNFLTDGGTCREKRPWWKRLFKKDIREFTQIPLAVTSRRRHISSIKNFFEYLKQFHEDKGKIFLINPVKSKLHAIKLKDQDVNHTKMLTKNDWEKVYEAVYKTKDRLAVYLLYWGGLRLSELTSLKFSDFNDQAQTLTLIRKGGSRHTLRLQNYTMINEQLKIHGRNHHSEYLFTNSFKRKLSSRSMYNLIKKILKKANVNEQLGPHSFRKACATNLYLLTQDLLLVRDYLNHSDAKVTQTYIDKETLEASRIIR